ncbi:hypothetical protein HNR00_005132 [Methylorubrum rhodinum]|uniref:Uncharacterized protein n=1 Tax=Methylorubrum rhodinum TaxID=29428 RepID=A0A840ZQ22_9HYPH|nr:hypothetical protein [Methylorubrum rhodinum]MBB5760382.1 hypothetical protein [Methylorubrum rhodinum]
MSVSGLAAFGHEAEQDTRVKVSKVKRRSFWSGVLQGLSGPALLGSKPEAINKFVEVRGNSVRVKIPNRTKHVHVFKTEREAAAMARAIAAATDTVLKRKNLVVGTQVVKRLDREGKLRELSRLTVQRRAHDAPSK